MNNRKVGIWIDGKKAVVVNLEEDRATTEVILSEIEDRRHHEAEGDSGSFAGSKNNSRGEIVGQRKLDNSKKFAERRDNQRKAFLGKVAEKMGENVTDIFVFGSGQMRVHLRNRLMQTPAQAARVRAVKSSGKLTDRQIVSEVKKFYNKETEQKTSQELSGSA